MRSILLLLVTCVVCSAQLPQQRVALQVQGPTIVSSGPANMVVDMWQDFEFGDSLTPTAALLQGADHASYTWGVSGVNSLMASTNTASYNNPGTINSLSDTGSLGLVSVITPTTGVGARYVYATINNGANATAFGLWFRGSEMTDTGDKAIIQIFSGSAQINLRYGKTVGGIYRLTIEGTTSAYISNLSPDTWYWISCLAKQSDTSKMRVWNSSGVEQESEASVTANNVAFGNLIVGSVNAYTSTVSYYYYYDNLVLATDGSKYPLKPWK